MDQHPVLKGFMVCNRLESDVRYQTADLFSASVLLTFVQEPAGRGF